MQLPRYCCFSRQRPNLNSVSMPKENHSRGSLIRCPVNAASSTGRCNTSVKSLSGGFECQSLARSFVELTRHFVQVSLRIHRQVGPLREILPQQAIGIFIGTALPRILRIAEVNVDVGR